MSEDKPAKRPVGRPTKYKPEYCEQIIQLGKEGKSIAQMASFFDVDKASIFRWAEDDRRPPHADDEIREVPKGP